jgi:hypothetical protein
MLQWVTMPFSLMLEAYDSEIRSFWPARSGAATDGLTHSIKQALELLGEVCNYCDQRFETPEVLWSKEVVVT